MAPKDNKTIRHSPAITFIDQINDSLMSLIIYYQGDYLDTFTFYSRIILVYTWLKVNAEDLNKIEEIEYISMIIEEATLKFSQIWDLDLKRKEFEELYDLEVKFCRVLKCIKIRKLTPIHHSILSQALIKINRLRSM